MLHRPDDKSAQGECCTPSGERSPSECDDRINLSAVSEELQSSVSVPCSTSTTRKRVPLARVPPRRLALCGGGIRCIAHIGVFRALFKAGILPCVKEVVGVSGGSLFGLLFVLGYKISEIEKLALELDFTILNTFEPETAFNFPFTYGLNSGQGLEKLVGSILRAKGYSTDLTFRQLASQCSRVSFRCYATELQTLRLREFSARRTPDASVLFAVRASMALPFIYTPVVDPVSKHFLCDGGLLHNLPVVFLTPEEQAETWSVYFDSVQTKEEKVENAFDYFQYIYTATTYMKTKPWVKRFAHQMIQVPIQLHTALDFGVTKEDRQILMDTAARATDTFLEYKPPLTQRPRRRYSVA